MMTMVVDNEPVKKKVLSTLRMGGYWPAYAMSPVVMAQHNTIIKNIKFLRDEGHNIIDRRQSGKRYKEYKLIEAANV